MKIEDIKIVDNEFNLFEYKLCFFDRRPGKKGVSIGFIESFENGLFDFKSDRWSDGDNKETVYLCWCTINPEEFYPTHFIEIEKL